MRDVGSRTIADGRSSFSHCHLYIASLFRLHLLTELQRRLVVDPSDEPFNTLVKAFSSYGEIDPELFHPIKDYLQRICVPEGTTLWQQGEPPDGLYIVESGILRAWYN